jgi:predicted transcriptional regulator
MKDQLRTLQAFLAADKPEWAEPIDTLLTAHLLARADDSMCARVSWDTLAKCCPVNETTVYRSLKRLAEKGWIVKHSGPRKSFGSAYVIQVDSLPMKDFVQTAISQDATKLAFWYVGKMRSVGVFSKRWRKVVSPRVRKGWQQAYGVTMQKWLNQGFNVQQIQAACLLVFQRDPKRALQGPQALKRDWHSYMKAIEEQKGTQQ